MTMPLRTLTESVDHLTEESHHIRDELVSVRREMERKNTRFAWIIGAVTLLLACTIAAAFQVSLNNRQVVMESQRRWCPVVEPLVPRADDPPPVGTPEQQARALRIRVAFAQLSQDFGCTNK